MSTGKTYGVPEPHDLGLGQKAVKSFTAYPVRAEVTKHDRPGRKSPGCLAVVCAAVGTIWGASKLGGRNITKYL